MAFLDEITSKAMDLMKSGLAAGEGALEALPGNPAGALLDVYNSTLGSTSDVEYWINDAGVEIKRLYDLLTQIITETSGSPGALAALDDYGFDTVEAVQDMLDALEPVLLATYGQVGGAVVESERLTQHTEDVKKNLPDIMKISGTANGLRNATTYAPVTARPDPSGCSQDGAVIAAITATTPPPTSSSIDEVAGTLTGDALQQASFACSTDLIAEIALGDGGLGSPPQSVYFFSIDVSDAVLDMHNSALNSSLPSGGSPIWYDAANAELGAFSNIILGWSNITDIADKAVCGTDANTELNNKISSERVSAGFPNTDGSALTYNGTTIPAGTSDELNLEASGMVAEIKSAAFAVSVVGFGANPCSQSIAARTGTPEVAVVGTSVAVAAITNTAGEEMSEVQGLTVVELEAKKLRIANASLFRAKQDDLAARIDAVNWESPAYTMMVRQKAGISSPVSLDFVIGVEPSGDGIDVEYPIPPEQILPPPPAGDAIDTSLMVSFDSPTSKNVLNGIADFLNSVIKDSGNEIANAGLKIWVFHSPVTGFYSLVIFGDQLTQYFAELIIHDASGEFSSFLFAAKTVDFIKDYMYTLKTEDELDEFETTVMVGIE